MKKWITFITLIGLLTLPIAGHAEFVNQDGYVAEQPVEITSVEIAAATPKGKIKPLAAFTTSAGLWTGTEAAGFAPGSTVYISCAFDMSRDGVFNLSLMIKGPKGSGPGGVGRLIETIDFGLIDFLWVGTWYLSDWQGVYSTPGYYDYKWRFKPGGQIKGRFVVY